MFSGLYTIPRQAPFLASLAAGLQRLGDAHPVGLADVLVLVPNRRSVRVLRELFLNLTVDEHGNGASILPRMLAFGDAAADDFNLPYEALSEDGMPPPVSGTERLLHLSRFVEARDPSLRGAQAIALARDLARMFDELALYECDATALAKLVPEDDYAEHWQQTLKFTSIITSLWPDYLRQIGRSDPAHYRAKALQRLADTWAAQPPQGPIIMAGLARAEPVLLRLAKTILKLPTGAVVLPGFDHTLHEDIWANLDIVHPDVLLRDVVMQLGPTRADVKMWPGTPAVQPNQQARADWVNMAMLPAAYTRNWLQESSKTLSRDCTNGVTLVTADDEAHEAGVVALAIRQALETPKQTVSLLTPDRTLARRVAALLQRWGIVADDSSGLPFLVSKLCVYLQLIAAAAAPDATGTDLLALLKHPLCGIDVDIAELEIEVLRGQYPAAGFIGLIQHLAAQKHDYRQLIDCLQTSLGPFAVAMQQPECKAAALLRHHIHAAENLAGTKSLWHGAEGEVASTALADVLENLTPATSIPTADYASWLMQLLATLTVRVPYGQHPRVTIHGLIEARLQQADVMIIAGLNEGIWPALPAANPWLNRTMRTAIGLPSPDEVIAQQAHDFVSALQAPTVVLTRAARRDGAPTVPARWWHRLHAVLAPHQLDKQLENTGQQLAEWARLHDAGVQRALPLAAPAPKPPVVARPRNLSVTAVEMWLRNPYGLYAKEILRLKKLDDMADTPGNAERGTFMHAALADFARQVGARPLAPADWALLEECGRKALAAYAHLPGVQAFWWPWFLDVAQWWWDEEAKIRPTRAAAVIEQAGQHTWEAWRGGPFTLRAKADRIDTAGNETIVVDYKTGGVPSAKDVALGLSPQLTLEAVLAMHGAYDNLAAGTEFRGQYWHLGSTSARSEIHDVVLPVSEAEAGLQALVEAFSDATTPYMATPVTAQRPLYDDYDHLARTAEWSVAEGNEDAA